VRPEVDPRTAAVTAIFEVRNPAPELPFGTAAEADVLLPGEQRAVVVPTTALLDDGGVTVAYVQLEGESFARREVRLRSRQGDTAAIDGVRTGERLVTRGGQAIRRASLLSTGAPEGHVALRSEAC
jgi:multidrug efflux pump subunit AcrA (membrane-fusion protein)